MKRKLLLLILSIVTLTATAQTFTYTGIDLKSEHVKKKNVYEWENMLLANYAYGLNGPRHAVGLTYARLKMAGFYVNAMVGTEWKFANAEGSTLDWFCTNKTSHPQLSLVVGAIIKMVAPVYAYLGAGYSYQGLNYQTTDGKWVYYNGSYTYEACNNHEEKCNHYGVLDVGLMGAIKGFTISTGYSLLMNREPSNGGCSHHIRVGLGYTFPDIHKKTGGAQ